MTDGRINEQILRKLRETASDEVVYRFLVDLLYLEAEHPGTWWWKREYQPRVRQYAGKLGSNDED
jgi:hypothetical protein